jgi:hypothetical protein
MKKQRGPRNEEWLDFNFKYRHCFRARVHKVEMKNLLYEKGRDLTNRESRKEEEMRERVVQH